jgi:preprotein translocase subunit SecF
MFIVKYRKIFYTLSIILLVASIGSIFFWGLKPGIDFTGGSLLDVSFSGDSPSSSQVKNVLNGLGFSDASVRQSGEGFFITLKQINPIQKETIIKALTIDGVYSPIEKTFSSVGPVLGKESLQKSWFSIVLVLLAIVLFVAFAFRKVSEPLSSWVYGIVTILALMHDVLVPTGVFAILGHLYGFEIDTLFVTALLVILGFSVHDTIVVFDRIRENLYHNESSKGRSDKDFAVIVGESINQTFVRSINTSLTTLLAVLILYFFGPEATKHFSLALLIGISVGTYSSIFIGSPLLITINNWKK